ncbi:MAG TPA: GNAT family N-acetyltransferase [Rubricoccaceae bacterium]|jgi:GNAT superfamily N-acetyltransferase
MSLAITAICTLVPDGDDDPDPIWSVTAMRDGLPTGVLSLTINRAPPAEPGGEKTAMCGWIGRLFVAEDQRGLGLGAALVAEAVRISREAGCSTCGLYVTHDNPARRLYERLGFVPCWPVDDKLVAHVLLLRD